MASYASDDLTPLLGVAQASGVGYRQGTIRAWDSETAENTVDVDGVLIDNLSILNTAEALLLAPGDVVGILTTGRAASSWAILGRLTIPGTPQAAATLGSGMKVNTVLGSTAISSTNFALNGGPTVTTQVLSTGRVFALFASAWDLDVGDAVSLAVFGFGPDGATCFTQSTVAAGNRLTSTATLGGTLSASGASGELIDGLTPGAWTFQLQSRKDAGVDPFVNTRVLTIMPQ